MRRLKTIGLLAMGFAKAPVRLLRLLYYMLTQRREFLYRRLYLAMLFLREDFDIIHCHFGDIGIAGAMLKIMGLKAKFITSFHGHDANRISSDQGRLLYHSLFKTADVITANTNFTKQQIVKMGCPEDAVAILPVGVRIEKFTYKERFLQPNEPVRILTVARLVEKKGHKYAINAVAGLIQNGRNVIYTIAGAGPGMGELKEQAASLGIENKVEFVGELTQAEVLRLYDRAHIFVLPSVTAADGDREGQGLVLQEAQAVGLPVVSTLHNGIPEGVLDGQSAFLVPEKDVDALAERLQYLTDNPHLWPAMGLCGSRYVQGKYDIKVLNKELLDIYEQHSGCKSK
jgi:colanic acid/amylovoran biosynthesis glycosyltransferase